MKILRRKSLAWLVPIGVEFSALGRSIILAHLISPQELGRAMLLALVLRLLEMISDLGVERLLIQAPDGGSVRMQNTLQAALVLRGFLLSALLLLASLFLARAYPDGPALSAYLALALTPVIRGFVHLDYRRSERHSDYRRLAFVELGSSVFSLGALVVAATALPLDHRILLAALIAQAMAQVALSHAIATRRYELVFSFDGLARVWFFGAPLAVNAGLMFLTLQADRLIVASAWGWEELAIYGIVAQLAFIPAQIVGRAANSVLLPQFRMSAARGEFNDVLSVSLRACLSLAIVFFAGFAVLAPSFIEAVYGSALKPSAGVAAAFALAAAVRILRTPISVAAVAQARTGDTARANAWRAAALVPAIVVAGAGAGLALFALTAVLGEVAAAVAGWRLLGQQRSSNMRAGVLTT